MPRKSRPSARAVPSIVLSVLILLVQTLHSADGPGVLRAPTTPPVSVARVIERHVRAAGGAEAYRRLRTEVKKGVLVHGSMRVPLEVQTSFPDRWLVVTDLLDEGVRRCGYNRKVLWVQEPDGRVQVLPASNVALERILYDSRVAVWLERLFPGLAAGNGATAADEVLLQTPGGRHRAVFDGRTGLLRRVDLVSYDDYREVDGVRVPFRVRLAEKGQEHLALEFHEVRHHVMLDDARFDPPPAATPGLPGR